MGKVQVKKGQNLLNDFIMQDFKLKVFRNENSKELKHVSLNLDDSSWIIHQLIKVIEPMTQINDTPSFFKFLSLNLKNEMYYDKEISYEHLESVLNQNTLKNDSLVYIVWDLETKVDLFRLEDLLRFWEFIWYDVSDEAIVLFVPCIEKLLLVTDHGFIKSN